MNTFISKNINEIKQISKFIFENQNTYKIYLFYGAMGSGKTTLIKEICQEFEVKEIVNSPTFSLVNVYTGKANKTIFHFDCYRLENDKEAEEIGIAEMLDSNNLCFIEWPEKIEKYLPDNAVKIYIDIISKRKRTYKIVFSNEKKET